MRIVEANRGRWVKMRDFGNEKNLESPLKNLCLFVLSDINPYIRSNLMIVLSTLMKKRKKVLDT